jgi:hypothetical protein
MERNMMTTLNVVKSSSPVPRGRWPSYAWEGKRAQYFSPLAGVDAALAAAEHGRHEGAEQEGEPSGIPGSSSALMALDRKNR